MSLISNSLVISCLIATSFLPASFINSQQDTRVSRADTAKLEVTLPAEGAFKNDRPVGRNWKNLIASAKDWNADNRFWTFKNGSVHGDYAGGTLHNYAWTKKVYTDFELNVLIHMEGKDANSGVCIRIQPTDADNAPGYQVDMGPGYWGSLWEERRANMVAAYPGDQAAKLIKNKEYNHYYIIAKGHHIQAWLNGVKTIDVVHPGGFSEGSIGLQLCHGEKHTVVDVKAMYIRELK